MICELTTLTVIPAKAGIHFSGQERFEPWIPASAGIAV